MEIQLDFTGPVALFPLPSVVFFPDSLLPLHVFEPRYRQMVHDALESDGLIAVALLKPGWESDYQGTPEIHEISTLGQIVRHEQLPDGRSNILLRGLRRIRPVEELTPAPYRAATIEVVDDRLTLEGLEQASELAQAIHEQVLDLFFIAPRVFDATVPTPGEALSPGRYFDRVADTLKVDPLLKQTLLAEDDVAARGEALHGFMEKILAVARRRAAEAEDDALDEDP